MQKITTRIIILKMANSLIAMYIQKGFEITPQLPSFSSILLDA
jgi:hypothetical protein